MTQSNNSLPHCPENLPNNLQQLLDKLALSWAESSTRPKLKEEVVAHWNSLIDQWISSDLPIFIRKKTKNTVYGKKVCHESGRMLVATDNSPAHWAFVMAYSNNKPNLNEIENFIEEDQVPVAMVVDKKKSDFKCSLNKTSPNTFGWKLAHKTSIGINQRGDIENLPINMLEDHFREFISPSNMFLVPKLISGLGELPEMTSVMKDKL
jgi:hypothetical protein